MSTVTRKEIAEVFKEAKRFLSPVRRGSGLNEFICHAIDDTRMTSEIDYRMAKAAQDVIMERVGKAYTAETWLRDELGDESIDAVLEDNPDAVQEWRHAWLDSLIKEFSK